MGDHQHKLRPAERTPRSDSRCRSDDLIAAQRITVYDAEASADARTQGGRLDLHEHNGQRALDIAGLSSEFRSIIHLGGAAQRVLDHQGAVLAELPDDGSMTHPEALRGDIRRILLESLPAETVQWGKKLLCAAPLGQGRHVLTFTDGSTVTTDVPKRPPHRRPSN